MNDKKESYYGFDADKRLFVQDLDSLMSGVALLGFFHDKENFLKSANPEVGGFFENLGNSVDKKTTETAKAWKKAIDTEITQKGDQNSAEITNLKDIQSKLNSYINDKGDDRAQKNYSEIKGILTKKIYADEINKNTKEDASPPLAGKLKTFLQNYALNDFTKNQYKQEDIDKILPTLVTPANYLSDKIATDISNGIKNIKQGTLENLVLPQMAKKVIDLEKAGNRVYVTSFNGNGELIKKILDAYRTKKNNKLPTIDIINGVSGQISNLKDDGLVRPVSKIIHLLAAKESMLASKQPSGVPDGYKSLNDGGDASGINNVNTLLDHLGSNSFSKIFENNLADSWSAIALNQGSVEYKKISSGKVNEEIPELQNLLNSAFEKSIQESLSGAKDDKGILETQTHLNDLLSNLSIVDDHHKTTLVAGDDGTFYSAGDPTYKTKDNSNIKDNDAKVHGHTLGSEIKITEPSKYQQGIGDMIQSAVNTQKIQNKIDKIQEYGGTRPDIEEKIKPVIKNKDGSFIIDKIIAKKLNIKETVELEELNTALDNGLAKRGIIDAYKKIDINNKKSISIIENPDGTFVIDKTTKKELSLQNNTVTLDQLIKAIEPVIEKDIKAKEQTDQHKNRINTGLKPKGTGIGGSSATPDKVKAR